MQIRYSTYCCLVSSRHSKRKSCNYKNLCLYPQTGYCPIVVPATCCQINTPLGNCVYCDNTNTCYYTGCSVVPTGGSGPPPPPGSSPTPSPTPIPPTPALPATLQAVAVQVTPVDTSCTAIHNAYLAGIGVSGTVFGFTVNPPAPQTQSGATLLTFSNVTPGTYTLTATPPSANWVVSSPCQYRNGTLVGLGYSVAVNGGDTVKWEIGYTKGTAYVSGRLGVLHPGRVSQSV